MTHGGDRLVQRFTPYQRLLHLVMFSCFLGLAVTGLPLHFSGSPWSSGVMRALGGFEIVGLLHRLFAFGMIAVFVTHLVELGARLLLKREPGLLWGPSSMVPQPRDAIEFVQHVRWFFSKGPRPRFGRYTYWEKFDYWAVFWGMLVIGGSGLILWFPQQFATVLPGWMFNIALVVHGEEALLATAFIFTIHYFNSHFRPEKFPMDMVMFTGRVTEEELEHERPAEYDELRRSGRLDALTVPPEPAWVSIGGRVIGTAAVLTGLALLAFILRGTLSD